MALLNYTIAVSLSGGPRLSVAGGPKTVEAFDKLDVSLPAGPAATVVVDLQPGGVGQLLLLVVRADPADEQISFVASDGTTDSSIPVTLEQPQTFLGSALGLFGVDPRQLKLTNDTTAPAAVEVLVVRNATVP